LDVSHSLVANVAYELRFGRGRKFGGRQVSAVTAVQSDLLFTPRLAFDDADVQSLLTSQGLTWLAILTRAVIQTIVE
jgi:hypothetical protein